MKKFLKVIIPMMIVLLFVGCGTIKNQTQDNSKPSENLEGNVSETTETNITESKITKEMAYEGVDNYCHSEYDWSIAEDNPEIMYVAMGDETETEYKVIFRSYTSSFKYFYVDKSTGNTRIVDYVPGLEIEEESGTISIYDYLNKNEEVNNQKEEGYEIIVSKNEITMEKGSETSFEITFTNPDESPIREFITCKDQDDIILVQYSNLENHKITVEVEGLKAGDTEIAICDYNYPNRQEIVKVHVIENN